MSGGHAHALHVHGHTVLHRLAPEVKIAAMVGGLLAIVLTPREQFWAFGFYGLTVIALLGVGEIPLGFYLRRVLIEAPFVAFAVFLPFLGSDPTTTVAGIELSIEGSSLPKRRSEYRSRSCSRPRPRSRTSSRDWSDSECRHS